MRELHCSRGTGGEPLNQVTAREGRGYRYRGRAPVDNIFCTVSINKRIPHQGHWISPTIMPFGGGVKISSSVHSNPKSVIMCWEHLLTARIPRVSVKRQRSGELLEAGAIVRRVPCAASVRQSCCPPRPPPAWIQTASR